VLNFCRKKNGKRTEKARKKNGKRTEKEPKKIIGEDGILCL
jgi:hypothetical protein